MQILDRLWNQITVSARASLAPSERPDAVAAEHRELLAAIGRGDRAQAGRIAASSRQRNRERGRPRHRQLTKEHEHVPQPSI